MKLLYTLIFLLTASYLSAQNDSIYPLTTTLHKGDTLVMVFKSKKGIMRLTSNGGCGARLMSICQFKKPAGWAEIFMPKQMDCGLPYVEIPNGNIALYPQNAPGTYRMVFFANGKAIETAEFTVTD